VAHIEEQEEAVNADSFLDIVASVVSVMIIMVVMTGLKIKNSAIEVLSTSGVVQANGDLVQKREEEKTLRGDVERIAAEMGQIQAQTAKRERERDILALAVTGLDQQLRGARQTAAQAAPDERVAAKVIDARNRLEILNRQREAIEKLPTQSVQIESFTTPLGRTVDGREVHFQLSRGRIAYVPLMELFEKTKEYLHRRHPQISEQRPELIDTVPPEQGFRLTYSFRLRQPTIDEIQQSGSQRPKVEDRFVLTPIADNLGETLDEALRPGSQFRQVLADRKAKDATVTLWTYPDSFENFRRLKKELYQLGFPVAARPLPEGVPISGSSSGSKSTAE
jgi:hypothetical protein